MAFAYSVKETIRVIVQSYTYHSKEYYLSKHSNDKTMATLLLGDKKSYKQLDVSHSTATILKYQTSSVGFSSVLRRTWWYQRSQAELSH